MKKFLVFIFLLLIPASVFADDCSYDKRVELNKEASKVTSSYEFIKNDTNDVIGFTISVYNLSDRLSLSYLIGNSKDPVNVSPEEYVNGTYSFETYNISSAVTYKFTIKANADGCFNNLKTISLTKPLKNTYADQIICNNEYLDKDFYYCREWLNTPITYSYVDVMKKIQDEIKRKTPTTTTICRSCELKNQKKSIKSDFMKIKMYIIIGLSIGIILDIFVLILSIKRARDDIF